MDTVEALSTDATPWALVTGASAGIGEVFCRQLAGRGYHLVLVARRADRLHSLAETLRAELGTASLVIPADLAETGAARGISDRLQREGIHIEFLVNNAGYGMTGRFTDFQWNKHADFIQVMMTAVCELTRYLLPAMQERKKGFVINVASVAGLIPGTEGATLYGASKAFLISFSQSLALENRFYRVNVSALCPGFTYSEFHDVSGTRDLVNRLPNYMWLKAEEVVHYGIESVIRTEPRVVAIPGRYYRLLVRVSGLFPGITRRILRKRSKDFRKLD